MSAKFIRNCSDLIDWEKIIASLIDNPGKECVPDKAIWDQKNPAYMEFYNMWEKANFNFDSIRWINYYPGIDYDESTVKIFEDMFNVTHLRSWISRINPGCCTPLHWDTDDKEEEYIKLGNQRRFVCHIGQPQFGHILIVEDDCHYNEASGNIYEWDNYKAWHAGTNCGITPKFLFNFLAYD